MALYAEATNSPGTNAISSPDVAITSLLTNRIYPAIKFVQFVNKLRRAQELEEIEIVFALEAQPQITNSVSDMNKYDPYIFDLGDPATVSRDYPMDIRTSKAYAWWSTSKYHHGDGDNVGKVSIDVLLTGLKLTRKTANVKGYISLAIYPIIWQMFNLKAAKENIPGPAKQTIDDYTKLVKHRVDTYQHYIKKHTGFDLLISEFGWPGSCGSVCSTAACSNTFEAMRPNTHISQQRKEQCIMWKVFKSLKVPKYYWCLGTDPRHSLCGNSVQQTLNGPGDENGWRITDLTNGDFIC